MKCIIYLLIFAAAFFSSAAKAQFAAQKEAAYLATIKVVADYKIDDEEQQKAMERLRNDQAFNRKLLRMRDKLTNSRSKDSTNRQVLDILERAGKELYDLLD